MQKKRIVVKEQALHLIKTQLQWLNMTICNMRTTMTVLGANQANASLYRAIIQVHFDQSPTWCWTNNNNKEQRTKVALDKEQRLLWTKSNKEQQRHKDNKETKTV